jgi:hypothetical protein
MLIAYEHKQFSRASQARIAQANEIIAEYEVAGFRLTLRQLYYQFVSRGLIPNTLQSYKALGNTINDARMGGLVSWLAIEDRTRFLRSLPSWSDPESIIESAAQGYHEAWWADQPVHCEVWIEKDALVGVFEGVCNELDVPLFSCRGYASASEVWMAGRRMARKVQDGKRVVVFHFGDHDPSGLDMTRDITDRLATFVGHHVGYLSGRFGVERVALTMDQISQYSPPPNPAKVTDSRFEQYQREYGDESWELDALEPQVLADLVRASVEGVMDADLMEAAKAAEAENKIDLRKAAKFWNEELVPVLNRLTLPDDEDDE